MHETNRAAVMVATLTLVACSSVDRGNRATDSPGGSSAGAAQPAAGQSGSPGAAGGSGNGGTVTNVGGQSPGGIGGADMTAGQGGGSPAVVLPGHGPGTFAEVELDAPGQPVEGGRFSLYVPDGVTKLTGLIVHQHGCGRDGISVPHDLHWQALANRWGMALMGTTFATVFPDGDHCDRWSKIDNGSGDLFVAALQALASNVGHAELSDVPWALWGHSGGASWVFQMAKKYPQKTLAVVIKSICEADPAFTPALVSVPILLATGSQDLGQCYPITTQIFESYRASGAPWAYVDEPEGTHDAAELRLLAIPYLDAVMAARLDVSTPQPRQLADNTGFLANNESGVVVDAGSFVGDASRASWLPSASAAEAWRQFTTTRTVVDSSAPVLAPKLLSAKLQAGQVALTWLADTDLESGVRAFRVYRDGSLALTVPSADQPCQTGNYGDEPEPIEPALSAIDPDPGLTYRVTLVNGSGLESPASEPLDAKAP